MNRLKSFSHAFNGLRLLIKNEHNARIHLAASLIAICSGIFLKISTIEWTGVLLCIGLVLTTEALNTALEELCNYVQPEKHPHIKKIKDIAAGAVLISAISAFSVGCFIFFPKVLNLC